MRTIMLYSIIGLLGMSGCQESPSERCTREAKEANKQCPKIIDSYTRLDSIKYSAKEHTFHYYHSLKGFSDEELKNLVTNPEHKGQITQTLINTAEMRYYMEQDIIFEYNYTSRTTGKLLGSVRIEPDEYK